MLTLRCELSDKQSLFDSTIRETPVTFYGGGKGGGKSAGLRLLMLKRRIEYPGSHGVIFRKTFPEVEGNHIMPLFEQFPGLKEYYRSDRKRLELPNRSILSFAYCQKRNDLSKHQGREYHDLGIEEAGEWSEQWFQTLRGSNRTGKAGIPARTILTGNPGGIGHAWLKRLFISKRYNERERASDYAFVPALVRDNPYILKNDPDYIRRLEAEPNEMLRRAYLHGDWDIAAGQFFSEFDRDTHVLPNTFQIPKHWPRFHSYDYGFGHPAVYLWWAVDEDGNLYVYREFYKAQYRVDQQIEWIKKQKDPAPYTWAGLDCWAQKGQRGPTIAEEFSASGIYLKPANVNRKQGAHQLRTRLAYTRLPDGRTIGPRIFFVNCPLTVECVTRMVHDPGDVEDVLKVDSVDGDPMEGDDGYDTTRYGIMSRPVKAHTPPPKRGPSYDDYEKTTSNVPWTAV